MTDLLSIVSYICLTWYSFMVGLSLYGQYISQTRYRQKPKPKSSKLSATEAEGVTIIRPLKGIDLELEINLRSSFEQNYPKFEILFSVASPNDPAIPIVERLIQEYDVDSRLIIGDHKVGINPKINNMIESYRTAKYDIVWILDSNVHVDSDTLGRSVDELLKPGIGLVHHLPIAVLPTNYPSRIEHIFLDTNHAKMYLAINGVGIASCVMGKSNLYRRSDLKGLERFGRFMAEDNLIGEALWEAGLRHRMSPDLACQSLGSISLEDYVGRRTRWVRLRKYIVRAATLVEPLTESIVCGLIGYVGLRGWVRAGWFGLGHGLGWMLNDLVLYRTLLRSASNHPVPLSVTSFVLAWVGRELLALPIYLFAMAGTKIAWRDQEYHCVSDGSAIPIMKDQSTSPLLGHSYPHPTL